MSPFGDSSPKKESLVNMLLLDNLVKHKSKQVSWNLLMCDSLNFETSLVLIL
jgi:hypothetical protein